MFIAYLYIQMFFAYLFNYLLGNIKNNFLFTTVWQVPEDMCKGEGREGKNPQKSQDRPNKTKSG